MKSNINFQGVTPADALAVGATAIGLPALAPVIYGGAELIDKAKNLFKSIGLDFDRWIAELGDEVARKLGKRYPRFNPNDLIKMMNDITVSLVGRNVTQAEYNNFFETILYGYEDLNWFKNYIKNSKEYKDLQKVAELIEIIKRDFRAVLAREPYPQELTNWITGIMRGEATEQNMIDSFYLSPEYQKAQAKKAIQKAVPYVIGAGIALTQIL